MNESFQNGPQSIYELAKMMKQIGKEGLAEDFAKMPLWNPQGSFNISKELKNLARNRNPSFNVEDKTLVQLSIKTAAEKGTLSDFINANFVDGHKQEKAYIATQGPLSTTSGDFWQMIWDQKCFIIVMTSDVKENDVEKCHQYWEKNAGDSINYGGFEIKTAHVESHDGYAVSTIEIKNLKTNEKREVKHFLCHSWPDFGAPLSPETLLNFVLNVRGTQAKMVTSSFNDWNGHSSGPPIVVHCSAGIGRTGVFILLDISILRLEDEGVVDLKGTLMKIRDQRSSSISMPSQNTFCYRALIDYALKKKLLSFNIDPKDFDDNNEIDAVHRLIINKSIQDAKDALKEKIENN